MRSHYPKIKTEFESDPATKKNQFHIQAVESIMQHVLPPNFFEEEDAPYRFQKQLPIVCWSPLLEPPSILTFFLCCKYRAGAFRFFYEMISCWSIPGKKLNPLMLFAVDFAIPDFGFQKYIGGQVIVKLETGKDFEILSKNLPIIESEIRLGVESHYQASRILEIKGLSSDEKTAAIQESIVSLIRRRPQDFDYDILSEMQHFLVTCNEGFKSVRSFRHMSRIICVHYLFRRALRHSLEAYPDRRYISVKLIRATVNQKKVLGLAIGISFIRDNEHFEAKHVLSGVKTIIPDAKLTLGSYFINKSCCASTRTLYLEVETELGREISLEEEKALKHALPQELKSQIAVTLNPIFMPQNEEEIMRHILTLSNELKFVRDLPQVIIDFNQQTEDCLEFVVILLRVVIPGKSDMMAKLARTKESALEYFHDRTKIVGVIRKKYKKEASVFRLRIQKGLFLRRDHSVDLYKARRRIVEELVTQIGDFRDYNGGIIEKETEVFDSLKRGLDRENYFLLENFFHSLNPPHARSLVPSDALKKLFLLVLEGESEGLLEVQIYSVRIQEDQRNFYFIVYAMDSSFIDMLSPLIEGFEGVVTHFFLNNTEYPCFGAIVSHERGTHFKFLVEKTMTQWSERSVATQV